MMEALFNGLMKLGHHIKIVAIMEGNIWSKVDLQLMDQVLMGKIINNLNFLRYEKNIT